MEPAHAPLCLSQAPALTPTPLLSLQQQRWAPEACRPFPGDRQGCAARQDCRALAGLHLRLNSSGPQGPVSPRWPLVSPQAHNQDIEKLKSQYRVLARDSAQARRKYQEASKGVWLPFLGERESRASPDPPHGDLSFCAVPHHLSLPLADKDRDKAKDKYVRSLWKLFAHHNRYVLGVRAAQLHHQHHHQLLLPGLLQSLQDLHQDMACIL